MRRGIFVGIHCGTYNTMAMGMTQIKEDIGFRVVQLDYHLDIHSCMRFIMAFINRSTAYYSRALHEQNIIHE